MKNILYLSLLLICFTNFIVAQNPKQNKSEPDLETIHHWWSVHEGHNLLLYQELIKFQEIEEFINNIRQGAVDEDAIDLVYEYDGDATTVTHFWTADEGDDQVNTFLPYFNIPNAFTKAKKFINGEYYFPYRDQNEIRHVVMYSDDQNTDKCALIDYYNNGIVYCLTHDCIETHSIHTRHAITMSLLGHICHLLEDMTTPAHVHVDFHPHDCYEEYCLANSGWPKWRTAGSFINPYFDEGVPVSNPIKYLFYTANQLADYFPSNTQGLFESCNNCEFPGNNDLKNGTNNLLDKYYKEILPNNPYNECNINWHEQRHYLANFANRITASLIYWFATEAEFPVIHIPIIIAGFLPEPEPPVICGVNGKITCEAYGIPGATISYQWTWENKPADVTITQNSIYDNFVLINWPEPEKAKDIKLSDFKLTCTVSNGYGQDTKDCYPKHSLLSYLKIDYPSICESKPTPIIIKNVNPVNFSHSFPVRFRLNQTLPTSLPDWGYKIFFKYDNGQEIIIKQVAEGSTFGMLTEIAQYVTIDAENGPCLNKPAEIILTAYAINDPTYQKSVSAFIVPVCENDVVCNSNLKGVNPDSKSESPNVFTYTFFNSSGPCDIPMGTYHIEKWKVEKLGVPMSPPYHAVIDFDKCVGYDEYFTQNKMWAGSHEDNINNKVDFFTYVYRIQELDKWIPCHKDSAAIVFHKDSYVPPYIQSIVFDPPVLNIYEECKLTCNYTFGIPDTYNWEIFDALPQTQIITTYEHSNPSYVMYFNGKTNLNNEINKVLHANSKKSRLSNPRIKCTVTKGAYSTSLEVPIIYGEGITGCPWLFVTDEDSTLRADNNILNKSKFPENIGQEITDKYVLNIKPGKFDNLISLNLMETKSDTSIINCIKLYAVDHPIGTKLCITEDNQIAVFDSASVLSTKEAFLNSKNITDLIQFHLNQESSVTGDTSDIINSYFENNPYNNLGIIIKTKRGPSSLLAVKDKVGFLSAYIDGNIYQTAFSKRENSSITAITAESGIPTQLLSNINVDWYRDFDIRYLAIADLSYSNYTISELPLMSAKNSLQNDVFFSVISNDSSTVSVNPSNAIFLKFLSLSENPNGEIRDYIFEVNGKIGTFTSKVQKVSSYKLRNNKNLNSPVLPYTNKLYNNYPNPFNPVTKINYSIEKQGLVKIKIFDILGREIKTLVNEIKNPGNYLVEFNGTAFASGVYFYRMEINGFTEIKKMVLIK